MAGLDWKLSVLLVEDQGRWFYSCAVRQVRKPVACPLVDGTRGGHQQPEFRLDVRLRVFDVRGEGGGGGYRRR